MKSASLWKFAVHSPTNWAIWLIRFLTLQDWNNQHTNIRLHRQETKCSHLLLLFWVPLYMSIIFFCIFKSGKNNNNRISNVRGIYSTCSIQVLASGMHSLTASSHSLKTFRWGKEHYVVYACYTRPLKRKVGIVWRKAMLALTCNTFSLYYSKVWNCLNNI